MSLSHSPAPFPTLPQPHAAHPLGRRARRYRTRTYRRWWCAHGLTQPPPCCPTPRCSPRCHRLTPPSPCASSRACSRYVALLPVWLSPGPATRSHMLLAPSFCISSTCSAAWQQPFSHAACGCPAQFISGDEEAEPMVAAQADAAAEEAESVGEGAVSPVEVRSSRATAASLVTLDQLTAASLLTAGTVAQTCDALACDGKVHHHRNAIVLGSRVTSCYEWQWAAWGIIQVVQCRLGQPYVAGYGVLGSGSATVFLREGLRTVWTSQETGHGRVT